MGRLIDAGLFLDNLSGRLESMKDYDAVKDVINNMPTAYDPEKVVKQLEKCAKGNCVRNSDSGRCPYIGNSEIDCEKCAMLRAIEIVKAGGVDA